MDPIEGRYSILEKKWSSKNPSELSDFFQEIRMPDEIERFMSGRQRNEVNIEIYSKSRDESIILVVPTQDYEGKNATAMKNAFPDKTIVFVESSGKFFNYAHSCNSGIQKALEFEPEWIIISNDDINLDNFPEALFKSITNKKDAYFLLPANAGTVSIIINNFLTNSLISLAALLTGKLNQFKAQMRIAFKRELRHCLLNIVISQSLLQRLTKTLSRKVKKDFQMCGYFMIGRAELFRKYQFDETFINDIEDVDLMLRIIESGVKIDKIDFKVEQIGGDSFRHVQTNEMRGIRDLANKIHLGVKLLNRK